MVLVGLDPGGAKAFGWCVVDDGPTLPLRIRASGVVGNAKEALVAIETGRGGDDITAAGIDAPLFWTTSGDRNVDTYVRHAICALGASSGTVNHVSSLRGACLVQGMVAAMMMRQHNPRLLVTEAHPKAALWMLGEATKQAKATSLTSKSISKYFDVGPHLTESEHERDAALAALAAWAMIHRADRWSDMRGRDPDAVSPLAEPIGYWMPA